MNIVKHHDRYAPETEPSSPNLHNRRNPYAVSEGAETRGNFR